MDVIRDVREEILNSAPMRTRHTYPTHAAPTCSSRPSFQSPCTQSSAKLLLDQYNACLHSAVLLLVHYITQTSILPALSFMSSLELDGVDALLVDLGEKLIVTEESILLISDLNRGTTILHLISPALHLSLLSAHIPAESTPCHRAARSA